MPSHIFTVVGLWEESIASNEAALAIQSDYYHAADFSVYAHLQLAQDAKAKALTEKSLATADRGDRPISFVNFTAKNAMPARYVLERADWAGAAALALKPSKYPQADSLTHFTRGLGMARTGNLARREAGDRGDQGAACRRSKRPSQSYWADRSEEQMLAISAWIALKDGARGSSAEASCARPPTARTAASSTSRWRTASIRCASSWASCCSNWARRPVDLMAYVWPFTKLVY